MRCLWMLHVEELGVLGVEIGVVELGAVLGWVNVWGVGVGLAPGCPQGGCEQEKEAGRSMRVHGGDESHVGAVRAARVLPPR